MSAEVIAVGSELVNGQKLDTNSQWISRRLSERGIPVRFHTVLGDDLAENVAAFGVAVGRARLVIVTGGLGPTQDDLTREALAQLAGVPLVEDADSLRAIAEMFARRNRTMTERNRVQALFPVGSEPLPNRVGTAPGIWLRREDAAVACLPGVPYEMKIMFEEQLLPRVGSLGLGGRVIAHRVVHLFGKGESDIEAAALDLTARGRVPEVGITVHDATISFRVSAEGVDEPEAVALMEPTLAQIRERFADLIVGEAEGEDVPLALFRQLARTGATLATAESCTGGLIASRLTEMPGVSDYFLGGVVSYANSAKVELLGVSESLLTQHGAVSPEVAAAMAEGIRGRLRSGIGLSVTGIAGPGGGSEQKPVGLVYLGLATPEGVATRRLDLGTEQPRDVIQSRSAKNAMNWARLWLAQRPSKTAVAAIAGEVDGPQ